MFSLFSFCTDLFCIRLESRNWSLFALWSTSGALSKQTWRNCSRVGFVKTFTSPAEKINGTCREWLIFYINSFPVILFYLQLILWTWIPWLSVANMFCAVACLSRALSTRVKMSVSLTYATAIYQALLTKWTIRSRWTEVGFGNTLSINLIYFLHFSALVSLHYTYSTAFVYSFRIN